MCEILFFFWIPMACYVLFLCGILVPLPFHLEHTHIDFCTKLAVHFLIDALRIRTRFSTLSDWLCYVCYLLYSLCIFLVVIHFICAIPFLHVSSLYTEDNLYDYMYTYSSKLLYLRNRPFMEYARNGNKTKNAIKHTEGGKGEPKLALQCENCQIYQLDWRNSPSVRTNSIIKLCNMCVWNLRSVRAWPEVPKIKKYCRVLTVTDFGSCEYAIRSSRSHSWICSVQNGTYLVDIIHSASTRSEHVGIISTIAINLIASARSFSKQRFSFVRTPINDHNCQTVSIVSIGQITQ